MSGAGGATIRVVPSGAARATLAAPAFMAPPATFSTITDLPQLRASRSATIRASVSVVEPGAEGTTIRTVRAGKGVLRRGSGRSRAQCRGLPASRRAAITRNMPRFAIGSLPAATRDSIADMLCRAADA